MTINNFASQLGQVLTYLIIEPFSAQNWRGECSLPTGCLRWEFPTFWREKIKMNTFCVPKSQEGSNWCSSVTSQIKSRFWTEKTHISCKQVTWDQDLDLNQLDDITVLVPSFLRNSYLLHQSVLVASNLASLAERASSDTRDDDPEEAGWPSGLKSPSLCPPPLFPVILHNIRVKSALFMNAV